MMLLWMMTMMMMMMLYAACLETPTERQIPYCHPLDVLQAGRGGMLPLNLETLSSSLMER
jgi:hypothetical protein